MVRARVWGSCPTGGGFLSNWWGVSFLQNMHLSCIICAHLTFSDCSVDASPPFSLSSCSPLVFSSFSVALGAMMVSLGGAGVPRGGAHGMGPPGGGSWNGSPRGGAMEWVPRGGGHGMRLPGGGPWMGGLMGVPLDGGPVRVTLDGGAHGGPPWGGAGGTIGIVLEYSWG